MYVTCLYVHAVHVLPTLIFCYFVVNSKYIFSVMNRLEMVHKYFLSVSLSISLSINNDSKAEIHLKGHFALLITEQTWL